MDIIKVTKEIQKYFVELNSVILQNTYVGYIDTIFWHRLKETEIVITI